MSSVDASRKDRRRRVTKANKMSKVDHRGRIETKRQYSATLKTAKERLGSNDTELVTQGVSRILKCS